MTYRCQQRVNIKARYYLVINNAITYEYLFTMATPTTTKRARLGPTRSAMAEVLGSDDCGNILQPLMATKGMVWPYTPMVNAGAAAAYSSYHFTHSNYPFWNFQNSAPLPLQVTGHFTTQTNEEGRYLVAVLRFLRAMTMMEFGVLAARRGTAGQPPPVLRFNYLGAHMFNNVPVIVTDFSFALEDTVDYVEVKMPAGIDQLSNVFTGPVFGEAFSTEGNKTYVPTKITITTSLQIQQNTRNVRENFDLNSFKRGDLINRGFI